MLERAEELGHWLKPAMKCINRRHLAAETLLFTTPNQGAEIKAFGSTFLDLVVFESTVFQDNKMLKYYVPTKQ